METNAFPTGDERFSAGYEHVENVHLNFSHMHTHTHTQLATNNFQTTSIVDYHSSTGDYHFLILFSPFYLVSFQSAAGVALFNQPEVVEGRWPS